MYDTRSIRIIDWLVEQELAAEVDPEDIIEELKHLN